MLRGIQRQYLGLTLACLTYHSACPPLAARHEAAYRRTEDLYRHRQMTACLAMARGALAGLSKKRQPQLYFRFRLLEAASLIGLKDPGAALAILSAPPPAGALGLQDEALWRMNLGMARLYDGGYEQATRDLQGAMRLAERTGSRSVIAEVSARQGALALRKGNNATAERLLRFALDVATEEGNASLRTIALGNLGVLLTQSHRLEEAVYWQELAADEFRKAGDGDSFARVTGNLGWSLLELGDLEGALLRFEEAEAEFGKAGNRIEQLIWRGNIGNVYFRQGEYAAADASYRRAAELARETNSKLELTWWLDKIAAVANVRKDWDAAEAASKESADLLAGMARATPDLTAMNNAAAIAAGRGRNAEAVELYQTITGASSSDPGPVLNAHSELAALYAHMGRREDARVQYRKTIELIERQRDVALSDRFKLPYLAGLTRFYQGYIEFLLAEGKVGAALFVADSSRSRMLRSASSVLTGTAIDYRKLAQQTRSVILAYWVAPERSLLWEITPDDIRLHALPGAATIRRLVAQHNRAIMDLRNPLSMEAGAGEQLWDILVGPAAESVARMRRVIIAPDGVLFSLNMESLPVMRPSPHYWLEDATISISSALWLLRPAPASREHGASLLLVGDAEPSGPEFPRLAYASRELAEIETQFTETERTVLRGAAASPGGYAHVLPGRFSMIHFVAHASSNPENPLQSGIVLSRSGDRYLLTAAEIMKTPLRARLVTISSCSSAGSRIYAGEGLVGLAWAFLRAGAQGVIAALWDIPDRATSQMMGALYRRAASGECAEEALREAKLAMLSAGSGAALPYNWAAFQYYAGSY